MDCDSENPIQSQVGVRGKNCKEKEDIVTPSSCIKVLEHVLDSHGILNLETLPTTIPKSFSFVAKDRGKASRPWACPICHFPFKYRGNLAEHIRFYHMKGNVPCNRCSKSFITARELRDHMREHSLIRNKCPHCGKHFSCKNGMPSTSYKFHLSTCKRKPKKPTSAQADVISKFGSIERDSGTPTFQVATSTAIDSIVQSNNPKSKQSTAFLSMQNKQRSKTNYCNLQYSSPSVLKCSKCCLEFEDEESVEHHICMTVDSIKQLLMSKAEKCNDPMSLKCSKCGLQFEDKESIENHICVTLSTISHMINPALNGNSNKNTHSFKCSVCALIFDDDESFENHICLPTILHEHGKSARQSNTLECNVCTLVFDDKESLENHICIPSFLKEHEKLNGISKSSKIFSKQKGLTGIQEISKVKITSESFISSSASCTQPANISSTFPDLTIRQKTNEVEKSKENIENGISFQIDNVFSLTQDQWKNPEIVDKVNESDNNISVPFSSDAFATKACDTNSELCVDNVKSCSKMHVQTHCKTQRETFIHKRKIFSEKANVQSEISDHSELNKKRNSEGKRKESQNSKCNTSVKSNDLSERKVNVTCGMCKSDFMQFNQFRFHFFLCKMLHLSTENKTSICDAKCNLCLRTFTIVTDYVMHLETCEASPNSTVVQNASGESPRSSGTQLSFNATLSNILTNCAIVLLRGADWQCIKCNCYFSTVPSALSHYNDCKNAPFSSDTSSFANYIRLICTKCNEVFIEVKDFENHKKHCVTVNDMLVSHSVEDSEPKGIKTWCTKCGFRTKDGQHPCKKLLKHMQSCYVSLKHLKTIRLNSKPYKKKFKECQYQCNGCKINFPSKQEYMFHMKYGSDHKQISSSEESINSQLISPEHQENSPPLSSISCHLEPSENEEQHDSVTIPPSVSKSKKTFWKCKSCQVIYTSLLALKEHVLSVHDDKAQNKYPFLTQLLTSEDTHQDNNTVSNANAHSAKDSEVHNVSKSLEPVDITPTNSWRCTFCSCQFSSNLNLKHHLLSCHIPVGEASITNKFNNPPNKLIICDSNSFSGIKDMSCNVWKCSSCSANYPSLFDLESHYLLYHQYICSCGLTMTRLQASVHDKLTKGTHQIISNELPSFEKLPLLNLSDLVCTSCSENFLDENSFLNHLKLFPHCAERYFLPKFICPLCRFSFSNQDSYLTHCRELHSFKQTGQSTTKSLPTVVENWSSQPIQILINSEIHSVQQNEQSSARNLQPLIRNWAPPVQGIIDSENPSVPIHGASVYQEHIVPSEVKLPQSSNNAVQAQNTNNTRQLGVYKSEIVSSSHVKSDGWMVLGNTNSQENASSNSQVINYVCSRCYRSQSSFENLSQHIEEIHKVHLHGNLHLSTVQARKT